MIPKVLIITFVVLIAIGNSSCSHAVPPTSNRPAPTSIVRKILKTTVNWKTPLLERLKRDAIIDSVDTSLARKLIILSMLESQFFSLEMYRSVTGSPMGSSPLAHYGALPFDYLLMGGRNSSFKIIRDEVTGSDARVFVHVRDNSDPEGKVSSSFSGQNVYHFILREGRWRLSEITIQRDYATGQPRTKTTTLTQELTSYISRLRAENAQWKALFGIAD